MRKLEAEELPNDVKIMRRVHESQVKLVEGELKPDRSVFKLRAGGEQPSAYRADLLAPEPGGSVEAVLTGKPNNGVVSIRAGKLRELNQELWEEIDPEDPVCGKAHLIIDGPKSGVARADLVEACSWEKKPPGTAEPIPAT